MAVDTPARIAIIGAGPIGLEAAIYARFLGYEVDIYERSRVCENLLLQGHCRSEVPFAEIRSNLGLAALTAQSEEWTPPADSLYLTGGELVEQYYLPLAQSDLLSDQLHLQTNVIAIGRGALQKHQHPGEDMERIEAPFRILTAQTDAAGEVVEKVTEADVVFDTSGCLGTPNFLGLSGIPAVGETSLRSEIEYLIPDLAAQVASYANQTIALIGDRVEVAYLLLQLQELVGYYPETKIIWISGTEQEEAPFEGLRAKSLTERDQTITAVQKLLAEAEWITRISGSGVTHISRQADGKFELTLSVPEADSQLVSCDKVVALVGNRPDFGFTSQLQVQTCFATESIEKLGKILLENPDLQDLSMLLKPEQLVHSEPDFYILGAKSFGRDSRFQISNGLQQIRDLFTIIGDREDLDLYRSIGTSL